MPGYDELVSRLTEGLPDQSAEGTLVHGDFRLDNTLVQLTTPARIAAVVDWEMSTLGDPLADLGPDAVLLGGWRARRSPTSMWARRSPRCPASIPAPQFAARYAELTGRDVSAIGYYIAFGYFKLAVVLEGIHARYLLNQTRRRGIRAGRAGGAGADRPRSPDAGHADLTARPRTPNSGPQRPELSGS